MFQFRFKGVVKLEGKSYGKCQTERTEDSYPETSTRNWLQKSACFCCTHFDRVKNRRHQTSKKESIISQHTLRHIVSQIQFQRNAKRFRFIAPKSIVVLRSFWNYFEVVQWKEKKAKSFSFSFFSFLDLIFRFPHLQQVDWCDSKGLQTA